MKTHPIKKLEDIEKMEKYFLDKHEIRNYTLFVMGINTALRISDLLALKWSDVYDFNACCPKNHIYIQERKTDKWTCIAVNNKVRDSLNSLLNKSTNTKEEYIFKSRISRNRPINRNQAYIIIKKASLELGIDGNISCHSLRKTFGYHAWKKGVPPALIMDI